MKTAFLCLLLTAAAFAQSGYTFSTSGTLTASGGDQTSCTLTKVAGASPSVTVACKPGNNGPSANLALSQPTGAAGSSAFSVGDITCLIGMNATSAAVSMGSLGSVPPSGASLSCSVNVRSGGPTTAVTGNVAVPIQTMLWP